eukprot:5242925-Alexandrium_andersonii.AAC.1
MPPLRSCRGKEGPTATFRIRVLDQTFPGASLCRPACLSLSAVRLRPGRPPGSNNDSKSEKPARSGCAEMPGRQSAPSFALI